MDVAHAILFGKTIDISRVTADYSSAKFEFTNESLAWLMSQFQWKLRGAWYFGTDIADLVRMLMVESETGGNTVLNNFFKNKVADILDALQMVIDRQKFCSEVHMLVEKCKVG